MFTDLLFKVLIAIAASVVATVSFGQDFYLTCDGVVSTEIVDRDSETRRDILRVQQIPSKRDSKTFIFRGNKVSTTHQEFDNCEISQFFINCQSPLKEIGSLKNIWSYYVHEINRISGFIRERFGTHIYGGVVNGRNAVQISTTNFDGNCKKTNQLAF